MENEAVPYGEVKEKVKNWKELNDWLSEDSETGNYLVKTKEGDFEFMDIPYERIMSAKKRATKTESSGNQNTDMDLFELGLIVESLVKPKIGELDLKKLKSSTVFKLRAAIYKLYDITSFLSL